jgi:hypothetical protein
LVTAGATVGENALGVALDQLVRRNLRGVWVRGALPAGAAVWTTNHHSWWDFFAAAAALRAVGQRNVAVLVDATTMAKPGPLRMAGVVLTTELRAALRKLSSGAVLVIFPEGELRPVGPVGPFRPGARWLADTARVPLLVVATRVVLRGNQAAEAYLDVTAPTAPGDDPQPLLAAAVARLDDDLAQADPMVPLPGFRQLVRGVRSWNERFGGAMVRS